jgi:hypothetical protein
VSATPKLREEWLLELAAKITPRIEEAAQRSMPAYRISCGFPGTGALSTKRRRIGECWSKVVSKDGVTELFISPVLVDIVDVGSTVAHELVHCIDEVKHGHKGPFVKISRAIGLEGKPTSDHAGEELKKFLREIAEKVGPYPHGGMVINKLRKVQTTRMIKCECGDCGYIARTTRQWLEEVGAPLCPCNQEAMEVAA